MKVSKLKKIPQSLKIEIFEKKPIANSFLQEKKYYLSDKIDLIEFSDNQNFQDLPYIFGDHKKFKNCTLI